MFDSALWDCVSNWSPGLNTITTQHYLPNTALLPYYVTVTNMELEYNRKTFPVLTDLENFHVFREAIC